MPWFERSHRTRTLLTCLDERWPLAIWWCVTAGHDNTHRQRAQPVLRIPAQILVCSSWYTQADSLSLQVLIFSQFKIMLDVLEDYLRLAGFPFERIDGSVPQREREAAINRYSKGARPSNPTPPPPFNLHAPDSLPLERIDGSVPQRERKAAINRYSRGACPSSPTPQTPSPYLRLAGFPFERINGSVPQREREVAINRYSKGAHTICVGNPTKCWSM